MNNRAVIEKCKNLANMLGFEQSGYLYYVDEFGCDLEILYHKGTEVTNETLYVWFGGVLVLFNGTTTSNSKFVEGIWISLVAFSNKYNVCGRDSSLLTESFSMIASCKKEAQKNREIVKKVLDCCKLIIKNKQSYKIEINGNKLSIDFNNQCMDHNSVMVVQYNGKVVFSYHYDCLTTDWFNDNKCSELDVEKEWIFYLAKLAS